MFKINFYLALVILVSFSFRYFIFNQSSNLVSATIGSLIPLALYFLIILTNPKTTKIAFISAIILSFNPLNLHFSNTSQWQFNLYPLITILISIILFKTINPQKFKKIISYLLFLSIPVLIFISRHFLHLYFSFLSPEFLIYKGDWQNIQQFAPYIGIILFPTYIFLLIGIFAKSKFIIQKNYFLLWLLLSPLPAVLKNDSTSLGLLLSYSIPLIYLASLGLITVYSSLSQKIFKKSFVFSLIFIYLISLIYFSDLYLNHLFQK
jgi:hypothetical protein